MVRRVLVVRGGWAGHDPVGCTDAVVPLLGAGWSAEVADSLDVYDDLPLLRAADLVVQCWSRGELTAVQERNLVSAVRAGTGFGGWHGGVLGTFVDSPDYLRMVGGRFVWHPDGLHPYPVRISAAGRAHPVTAGVGEFVVPASEQYWVLTDGAGEVLATSTFAAGPQTTWHEPVQVPVVWARRWGRGRVFVSTIGHGRADLLAEPGLGVLLRGLRWAARTR